MHWNNSLYIRWRFLAIFFVILTSFFFCSNCGGSEQWSGSDVRCSSFVFSQSLQSKILDQIGAHHFSHFSRPGTFQIFFYTVGQIIPRSRPTLMNGSSYCFVSKIICYGDKRRNLNRFNRVWPMKAIWFLLRHLYSLSHNCKVKLQNFAKHLYCG